MLTLPPALAPMAVLALLLAPPLGADLAGEDRRYVGLTYLPVMAGVVTGLQVYELDSALLCDRLGVGVGVGGACFVPPGWARYARLAAFELAALFFLDGGVTLQVWLFDDAGSVMDMQVTCASGNASGRIDVLPGTAELVVVVLPGGGTPGCGGGLALGGRLHVYYG